MNNAQYRELTDALTTAYRAALVASARQARPGNLNCAAQAVRLIDSVRDVYRTEGLRAFQQQLKRLLANLDWWLGPEAARAKHVLKFWSTR